MILRLPGAECVMATWFLEVVDGHGGRRQVELDRPRLLIGREPTCDIHLPHPGVSRRHAQLQRTDQGRWLLQDLRSRNHVFVDNKPVQQVVLEPRQPFRIAEYWLMLHDTPPPEDLRAPEIEMGVHDTPPLGDLRERYPPLLPGGLVVLLSSPELERKVSIVSDWQPGDRIEHRWEVQSVLGGGMGIVYVVLDHETGERLAAKTYRDDVLAAQPDLPARFEREALAWINLGSHPNVVKAKYFKRI